MTPEPAGLRRRLQRGTVVPLSEAARRLGVSVRQVRRYMASGQIPAEAVERYRRPDGRQRVVVRVLALVAGPLRSRRGLWRRRR